MTLYQCTPTESGYLFTASTSDARLAWCVPIHDFDHAHDKCWLFWHVLRTLQRNIDRLEQSK